MTDQKQDPLKCPITPCGYKGKSVTDVLLHRHVRHDGGGLLPFDVPGEPIVKAKALRTPDQKRVAIRNQKLRKLTRAGKQKRYTDGKDNDITIYMDEYAEIWYVDTKGKHRKICGAHRTPKGSNAICLYVAGRNTNHKGYGRCSTHLGNAKNQNNGANTSTAFLAPFMNQEAHSLHESFERITKLSDEIIFSVETPLRVAYAVLDEQLKQGNTLHNCKVCGTVLGTTHSSKSLSSIKGSLNTIMNILKTDAEIKSKLMIDPLAIAEFIKSVMDAVMPYVPADDRIEVIDGIMRGVLLPLGNRKGLTLKGMDIDVTESTDVEEIPNDLDGYA